MKYCITCGAQILSEAIACPHCGMSQISDEGHFGYFIAGLLLPIPGLMLYLALKDIRPNTASRIKSGIIVFLVLPIVILLLMGILGLLGLIMM